ncbi:MAG: universal stress protein [Elusimicrobia bacterium]|nr:universal stress protein [Elusimicrobiota bacterium]
MKRFPPRRILVAADLSAPSLSAIDAAKALARRWGSALEIVYISAPAPVVWTEPGLPVFPLPATTLPAHKIRKRLLHAAAGFPRERLKLRMARGWPVDALLEMARPERADLLVMGTHGYAGLDRLLTGSVSEAVIRRASIPVLAVPARKGVEGTARVLAPWNASPYATRALRWAREVSRGLGATLDVLHVKEAGLSMVQDWPALRRRLKLILGDGPDWTLRVYAGDARARIVEEANSGRYGLVALSAHRRPFAGDFALGSTIERALRHSFAPILAVPSGRRPRSLRRVAARAGSRIY